MQPCVSNTTLSSFIGNRFLPTTLMPRNSAMNVFILLDYVPALDTSASRAETLRSPPDSRRMLTVEEYERLAQDLVLAFDSQDEAALQRVNQHYERAFTFDDLGAEIWHRVYSFRQRSSRVAKNYLALDEARVLIAQNTGFGSWDALTQAASNGRPPGRDGRATHNRPRCRRLD